MTSIFRPTLLPVAAAAVCVFHSAAWAQEAKTTADTQLQQITVKGQREAAPSTVETKTAEAVQKEMIRDTRDIVRYSADVGIAENGARMKGFAMRGVEGNRVGLSVDGVALPDFEENSLYQRYGNFNNSRITIDPELVTGIDVVKGSDSFNMGSGSLGGGVNYRTLRTRDIVAPGQRSGFLLRTGYASKNREWVHTVGAGFVGEQFDLLALHSYRYGHEMKAEGTRNYTFETDRQGRLQAQRKTRRPDPLTARTRSGLVKLGWQINDAHRVGLNVGVQRNSAKRDELTYGLGFGTDRRFGDDRSERKNINLHHIYTPEASDWLASAETELDIQKTKLSAITSDFTYGGFAHARWPKPFEIKNRSSSTDYKRLGFKLEALTQNLWGAQHTMGLRFFYSERDFSTLNVDTNFSTIIPQTKITTIQYPVQTKSLGFAFKDDITWYDGFSTNVGLRWDYDKITPQELNAKCSDACLGEGKPEGNSFSVWNAFLGFNKAIHNNWTASYQISTGHRLPTASEMYFTFEHPSGNWKSNRDLKAERSVNHTFALVGQRELGRLEANLFRTNYRQFLHERVSVGKNRYGREQLMMQMINLNKARVTGLEFKGHLNLDQVFDVSRGWSAHAAVGYSKGKLSSGESLLSIQPIKAVLGLDYQDPSETFGVFSRLTYLGAKKEKDTKLLNQIDHWTHFTQEMVTYRYSDKVSLLNDAALTFDIYGYYKPVKNLTLRAGIYNIFDRKYFTWDAMRSINPYVPGATNSIPLTGRDAGKGLERYAAPGRNFSISAEYRF